MRDKEEIQKDIDENFPFKGSPKEPARLSLELLLDIREHLNDISFNCWEIKPILERMDMTMQLRR